MENAKKIIRDLRENSLQVTELVILNTLREYLQTIALKLIYQSKQGAALSFMGGTALRICHGIKRYSEDMDFARDDAKIAVYDFSQLMQNLRREFMLRGFALDTKAHADKTVQKGYLSFAGLRDSFALKSWPSSQKLHVKIEVDVKPVSLRPGERESFFVTRFGEIFPILKHGLPTLFAGKILALFNRSFDRGRDYYDLIWYLSQNAPLNIAYLNRGMGKRTFHDEYEVFDRLSDKIGKINTRSILKDMTRFLEDPADESWLKRYPEVFAQMAAKRKSAK